MAKDIKLKIMPPPAPSQSPADDWVHGSSSPAIATTSDDASPSSSDAIDHAADGSGVVVRDFGADSDGRLQIRIGAELKERLGVWCLRHRRKPARVVAEIVAAFLDGNGG